MPLFGFRTHKKYDKDFSAEKPAKGTAEKGAKKSKPSTNFKIQANKKPIAAVSVKAPTAVAFTDAVSSNSAQAIIRPHVTEKSGITSQNGAYTFVVSKNANKQTVANAVKTLYKVNPVKVAMITVHPKNVFVRGKRGTVSGMKKAIVTIKKGEKIDFV